jgi:hypothetical protein
MIDATVSITRALRVMIALMLTSREKEIFSNVEFRNFSCRARAKYAATPE